MMIMAALIAALVYAYQTYQAISVTSPFRRPLPTPTSSPIPDTFNQGRTQTTLLMGYGGGNHDGGLLTDTMMLVIIHPPSQTITLLSLPRDLWVQLPVNGEQLSGWKLNAAYAIGSDDRSYPRKLPQFSGEAGGGELAKYAVKQATGLDVDHFITLNFSGFRRSIDVLGGVDVYVERSFDDYLYPIEGKEKDPCGKSEAELQMYATMAAAITEQVFSCRYEHLRFEQGMQTMDGTTALKYVRSRHSAQDGTDFGRAARQRNLILAVRDKMFRLDFFPKLIPFVNTLAGDVRTDYTLADIQNALNYRQELRDYRIISAALSDQNVLRIGRSPDGQSIVMPQAGIGQWDQVHGWLAAELERLRDPDVATPSAVATGSAAPTPAALTAPNR